MVQLIWGLLVAAAAVDAIPGYGSCPASDKCLKAVKTNGSAAATKDCKAVLQRTLTSGNPCTKTITARVTKTSTVLTTKTNTFFLTQSIVSTFTPVETVAITSIVTPTAILEVRETPAGQEMEKRQPPPYASKSCNANQYKSACSCIGVRPSTKTVTPSERTVTKTSTVSTTRITNTRTVSIALLTTTIVSTETVTPTTTTEIVTLDPADAQPTEEGGCQIPVGVNFYLVSPAQQYLQVDNNGIITTETGGADGKTKWTKARSGLIRAIGGSEFALKTTDGGDLTYLFGSTDLEGAVLQCEGPNSTEGPFSCIQGSKSVFYECPPATVGGSTIAIGDPAKVGKGSVGFGCRRIRFGAMTDCQK